MIISASYKTDIPAFYGEWFVNRLRAGYCMMRNPMNRKEIRVSLKPTDVNGIVFWTKNFRPFMKHLPDVVASQIPFIVQYTVNGYPKSLENNVVPWERSAEAIAQLADQFGPRCVIWRYDTVIYSIETPAEFHIENFARIAEALRGKVDEAVISFMQLYRKTARNMSDMAAQSGNDWWDPPVDEKRALAQSLFEIAQERGMALSICSQPELVSIQKPARCIDSDRLADVGGSKFSAKMLGNRPGCECAASRDIGDYDTCPHGCVYCYAVRSQELAIKRFRTHDPASDFLFNDGPSSPKTPIIQPTLEFDTNPEA